MITLHPMVHELSAPDSLPDSVHFPGAPVLTYICSNGSPECGKYCHKHILQLARCGEARHVYFSIYVHRSLYDDGTNGSDGELQSHRNPKRQKSSETVKADSKILPLQMAG